MACGLVLFFDNSRIMRLEVFGGSVSRPAFLERVRKQFAMLWNDYLPVGSLDEYIVNPSVPENGSATLGNFALAKHLIETNK